MWGCPVCGASTTSRGAPPGAAEPAAPRSSAHWQRVSPLLWHFITSSACTVTLPRLAFEQPALIAALTRDMADFSPPCAVP